MIFKREINPRDYGDHWDMIDKLQVECVKQFGVMFEVGKIAMGQINPNGELWWFEGFVDEQKYYEAKKKIHFEHEVGEAIKFLESPQNEKRN